MVDQNGLNPGESNGGIAVEHLDSCEYVRLRSRADFDAFSQAQGVRITQTSMAGTDGEVIVAEGLCSICKTSRTMRFRTNPGKISFYGGLEPDWTETGDCSGCGIINRQRAFHAFAEAIPDRERKTAYISERRTPAFSLLRTLFAKMTGSEYMGPDRVGGRTYFLPKRTPFLRHEDLTRLSFADESMDVVMSQEVLEHVPNYSKALAEKFRILKPGGVMLCTAPFFPLYDATIVRAEVTSEGQIIHHHPPVYHANPVSTDGSLCFNDFGWDLLDTMRSVGFIDPHLALYWSTTNLGFPLFVMRASK